MGVFTDTRIAPVVSVGRAILLISASSLLLFHAVVGSQRPFVCFVLFVFWYFGVLVWYLLLLFFLFFFEDVHRSCLSKLYWSRPRRVCFVPDVFLALFFFFFAFR